MSATCKGCGYSPTGTMPSDWFLCTDCQEVVERLKKARAPAPSEPLETSQGGAGIQKLREAANFCRKNAAEMDPNFVLECLKPENLGDESKPLDASGKPLSGSEASPLEWTREKPTREGWYFRRICSVDSGRELERIVVRYRNPIYAADPLSDEVYFEYAGPFPEPLPRRVPAPPERSEGEQDPEIKDFAQASDYDFAEHLKKIEGNPHVTGEGERTEA